MRAYRYIAAAWAACLAVSGLSDRAAAQALNQLIVFGDSTVDSGWYRNPLTPPNSTNATFNADFALAVTQGAGKATTSPGLMNPEVLAGKFGLTATPANQPGGTNYATGDARNSQVNTTGLLGAIPTATQVTNYLAATGGSANPNALYVVSSGGNDVLGAATLADVTTAANSLVATVARLRSAGANIIIVPNQPASLAATPGLMAFFASYNSTLWSGLAATGVNFVPADINAVLSTVRGNATVGITATGPACTQPAGIASGWASLCSATSTVSTLVSPDAAQTHLFADNLHLSTAGQQIVADYEYSLLVAPSMISMMAEAPIKTRATLIGAIDNQIELSQRQRGPMKTNAWVSGDVSSLRVNNAPGFPNDPGTPATLVAGIDHKLQNDWLIGLALSFGTQRATFSGNFGSFRQDEYAVSAYAGRSFGPSWFRVIGTYGSLAFDVNRTVPVGIATLSNTGGARGGNLSLSGNAGYDLIFGTMAHGPIAGMTFQRVKVGSFTENGSFTALSFDDQTRLSAVSALGYQAAVDIGPWRPFVRATWNHEWVTTDRRIMASLTTSAAPSYTMPAVVLGHDWGTASVGTSMKVSANVTGLVALYSQFAQSQVTAYGGQVGVNAAF